MTKIVVYGDNRVGSGGWSYAETLRETGHEVRHVSAPESAHSFSRWPARLRRKLTGGVSETARRRHVAAVQKQVDEFATDIVIVLKGLYLGPEDVTRLKSAGRWVCNINHDDFFSDNPNNWSQRQRAAVPCYDFVFTTRTVNVDEIRPLNRHVEFFPFAFYPRIHRQVKIPAGEEARWHTDIVFVGTYEKARARLLEELVRKTSAQLAIHGDQWHKLARSSPLCHCVRSPGLWLDDYCKAIGGAKIALGFLRKENRDDYTQRTFEIPACGGLLLGERTEQHLGYYREGIEAEFFDGNGSEELCAKADALLADSDRREEMREAGRAALWRGGHTYRDRLERLLEIYERR